MHDRLWESLWGGGHLVCIMHDEIWDRVSEGAWVDYECMGKSGRVWKEESSSSSWHVKCMGEVQGRGRSKRERCGGMT